MIDVNTQEEQRQMSKGSKQRPTDKRRYDDNYESINWTCKTYPSDPTMTKEQMDEFDKQAMERALVNDCPVLYRWPESEAVSKKR